MNLLHGAIETCVSLDERHVQPDAQYLYNTFNLITTILDGCDESQDFSHELLSATPLLRIVERQFSRDDFDENVFAAIETLEILLQTQPRFIAKLDVGLLNLLLRFCANQRRPASASEDEAACNGFDVVALVGMDSVGNQKIAELNGVEILLNCWSPTATTVALVVRTLDAVLGGSPVCCDQFVDAGGLKKLFLGAQKSTKYTFAVVGIIESLLTILPVDSVSFKRVVRKFAESDKVPKFVEMTEFVSANQTEGDGDQDDPAFDAFMRCCAVLAVLFAFSVQDVRLAVLRALDACDMIDIETVIETAELRVEECPAAVAERIRTGTDLLRKIAAG
jgi:hypothetical protein